MINIKQRLGCSISSLCTLLGYSRQNFYQTLKRAQRDELEKELIIQQVIKIRETQEKVGTRKLLIHLDPFLNQHQISIGRDCLFNLLAEYKLLVRKRKRKVPVTTFSNHWLRKYPNLIIGIVPMAAHQLWVSDITYIRHSQSQHGYLSLVTDAYSRKIVGYYLSKDLSAEGCIKALKKALAQLPTGSKLIHHSDRGCQYCSFDYVALLQDNDIRISMTQSGDPLENAIAERVNGILKQELLKEGFMDLSSARRAVEVAILVYNNIRLHSSIDMLTPEEAHRMEGTFRRHWKTYYLKKGKEVISY